MEIQVAIHKSCKNRKSNEIEHHIIYAISILIEIEEHSLGFGFRLPQ